MGDDFIAQHKDHYNRSLTRRLDIHLKQSSLFKPQAKEVTSYPCQLNDAYGFPTKGQKLMLRLVGDVIELLDQQRVIGFISPEANQDAINDFKNNPTCMGILTVNVVAIFQQAGRIDVCPNSDDDGEN
jgi:hypothetical protein